jgi:NAD/NADP transhydrogenase alpha subunit
VGGVINLASLTIFIKGGFIMSKSKNIKTELEKEKDEKINMFKVKINYVEDNAIVTTVAGYAKRIYFDLTFKDLEYIKENKKAYENKMLTIYYIGDILDAFNTKILPIKSLDDIGVSY